MLMFKKIFHYKVISQYKVNCYHIVEFLDGTRQILTEDNWKDKLNAI